MLDFRKFVCLWIVRVALCVSFLLAVPGTANPIICVAADEDPVSFAKEQAAKIAGEGDIKEIIRLIIEFRRAMIAQGCKFPHMVAVLEHCRAQMIDMGLEIDDDVFEYLREEFQRYDDATVSDSLRAHFSKPTPMGIKHHHKKHRKKDNEIRISSKMGLGFLKFVGGTLLCIVPIPLVQGAGASLAVLGVNDMINAARDDYPQQDVDTYNQQKMVENRQLESR